MFGPNVFGYDELRMTALVTVLLPVCIESLFELTVFLSDVTRKSSGIGPRTGNFTLTFRVPSEVSRSSLSCPFVSIRVKGNLARFPFHTYVVDASVIVNSILIQHIVNESPALLQGSVFNELHVLKNEFFLRLVLFFRKGIAGYINQLFLMEIERCVNVALSVQDIILCSLPFIGFDAC